jgi:hypothetical protein
VGRSAPLPPHFQQPVEIDGTVSRAVFSHADQRTRADHRVASSTVRTAVMERLTHPGSTSTAYLLQVLLASFAHALIRTETRAQHLHQHLYCLRHRALAGPAAHRKARQG